MKKVLCFLSALIILLASFTAFVGAELYRESDNVTFRLIDEWGNREYLSGVTTESEYYLKGHLNWAVEFSPYENEVNTEYSFRKIVKSETGTYSYGFATPSFDLFDMKNENERLKADIEALKSEAVNAGDIRTLSVKMADYFEYYPVNLNLRLPGMSVSWQSAMGYDDAGRYSFSGITPSRGSGFIKALNEYFKIPVIEEDVRYVKIHAGDTGSYTWQCSMKNSFDFTVFDAVFSDTVYFTFRNEFDTDDDVRLLCDTSQIPGGYGIYALPYSKGEIGYEALETVYSIPADSTVKGLWSNEERNELYLTLYENDRYVLHVIDVKTMTDISVVDVFSFSYGDYAGGYQYDDFFVFIKNETEFFIVKREADGTYSSGFGGVMPAEYVADRDYFSYYSTFDFDGERLAVFVIEEPFREELRILSIQPDIMIFTEDGIQYYGKWGCSLGAAAKDVINYDAVWRKTGYSVKFS